MDSEIRDKEDVTIPFVAFERAESAYERHIKRLWILCIILLVLLVGSNIAWLCFISGYDFEKMELQQDGSGINIVGDENKEVTNYGTEHKSVEDDQTERSTGDDDQNAG